MSGGSAASNSWTILNSESVAEPLKPSAEGTERHAEELTLASGSVEKQPDSGAEPAEGRPLEAAGGKPEELTSDTSADQHTSLTAALSTDASLASSVGFSSDTDARQSEGLSEGPTLSAPDPDLFSDSYSHISPSPNEPSATQLSIETLGGAEPAQEDLRLSREESAHYFSGEKGTHDVAGPETCDRKSDVGKPAASESPVESEVGEQKTAGEARRRRSLLAALERIGRTEEEEEKEEELQPPQRDEESGFTVNKCILGAVILVGIGTVFFSGSDYNTRELRDSELPTKQEDWLSPEALPLGHADNKELLNKLAKGNEQISVLNAQLQAQREELKVTKGQAAEEAKERLRWEEVERENSRLKKEVASLAVLHKENERMKREMESVRGLQKELETLKATLTESKRLAAPEAAQRSTTSYSSGQPEDSVPDTADGQPKTGKNKEVKEKKKKEERVKEKSEWKEREKRETKDEGKAEWKKEQHGSGKFDKEKYNRDKQKRSSDEPKQKEKDWKKERAGRGDEGKPWKDRKDSKELREKNERKEWNEEKEWKKSKHREVSDSKHWQGRKKEEKRDWEVGKEHGEKHRGKEDWRGESKWRKGKDEFKEQWETKEWKKDKDQSRNGKEYRKEGKWEEEKKKKPWEESRNQGRDKKGKDGRGLHEWKGDNGKSDGEGKRKEERKQHENKWRSQNDKSEEGRKHKGEGWKSRGDEEKKDWKRKDERGKKKEQQHWKRGEDEDTTSSHWHKGESSSSHGHQGAHLWGERKPAHTHRQRPSPGQPEYWDLQRSRLQHNPRPRAAECGSAEACAQAEGLRPVTAPEFHAILQTYLARAEELGADPAEAGQLSKLTAEFFPAEGDGGGVFTHDCVNFRDFAKDVSDILEDLLEEGGAGEEDGESSDLEDEMEEFQREVVTRFLLPGGGESGGRARA